MYVVFGTVQVEELDVWKLVHEEIYTTAELNKAPQTLRHTETYTPVLKYTTLIYKCNTFCGF